MVTLEFSLLISKAYRFEQPDYNLHASIRFIRQSLFKIWTISIENCKKGLHLEQHRQILNIFDLDQGNFSNSYQNILSFAHNWQLLCEI